MRWKVGRMQAVLDSSEAVSQCEAPYMIKNFCIREYNPNFTPKNVFSIHSNQWKMLCVIENAI